MIYFYLDHNLNHQRFLSIFSNFIISVHNSTIVDHYKIKMNISFFYFHLMGYFQVMRMIISLNFHFLLISYLPNHSIWVVLKHYYNTFRINLVQIKRKNRHVYNCFLVFIMFVPIKVW